MSPAAVAMRLLYWKTSPYLLVGAVWASMSNVAAACVVGGVLRIHSKSLRGTPVQAQTRSLTRTFLVISALPSRNDG